MSVFRILETGNKKKGTHRGLEFHVSFLQLVEELENKYVGGEDAARVDGKTYDKAERRLEALQRHWTYVGGYTLAQVDRDAGDSLSVSDELVEDCENKVWELFPEDVPPSSISNQVPPKNPFDQSKNRVSQEY